MAQNADHHKLSDEIDLRGLIQTLWTSRILIAVATLLFTSGAAVYAILAPSIYETSVVMLPPTQGNLATYNLASQLSGSAIRSMLGTDDSSGIRPLTPEETYKAFLRRLASDSIRQTFFDKYYLPVQLPNPSEADKQRMWRRLDKRLTISLPSNPREYEAIVLIEGNDPVRVAEWANVYVQLAVNATKEDLLDDLYRQVEIRSQSISEQISALREIAKTARQNRIIQLEEALKIAESIGLNEPSENLSLIALGGSGYIENPTASVDYLRGAKALRSELDHIKQRIDNDAYIPELPDLLKKQALLKSINLDPNLLSVVTVDREAIVPAEPSSPNRIIIVLFGCILGLMLGALVAIGHRFFRSE